MSTKSYTCMTLGPGNVEGDGTVQFQELILDEDSPTLDLASQVAWDGEYGDPPVQVIGVFVDGTWEVMTKADVEEHEANVMDEKLAPNNP